MIWQISAHFLHLHIQIRIQYRTVFYQKPGFANLSTECLQLPALFLFQCEKVRLQMDDDGNVHSPPQCYSF